MLMYLGEYFKRSMEEAQGIADQMKESDDSPVGQSSFFVSEHIL